MQSRELADLIDKSNNKIVSVSFIKKDGTLRQLVGRLGVTKHLKGGNKTVSEDQYITIFDMQKQAYRSVNRDTIVGLKAGGINYESVV